MIVALIVGLAIGGFAFGRNYTKTVISTEVGTSVQTIVSISTVAELTQTVSVLYTTTEVETVTSFDPEVAQLENEIHLYDIQYLLQNEEINLPAGGVWSSGQFFSNETGYIVVAVASSTSPETLVNCHWVDFLVGESMSYNQTVNVGENGVAHFPFIGSPPGSSSADGIQINLSNKQNSSMTAEINVLLVY
jgi:hypothetical protein